MNGNKLRKKTCSCSSACQSQNGYLPDGCIRMTCILYVALSFAISFPCDPRERFLYPYICCLSGLSCDFYTQGRTNSPCVFEYNEYFDYLCTRFWYILGDGHQMRDTDSWDSYFYALVRGNQR